MIPMVRFLLTAFAMMLAGAVAADDLPFGADALRHLTSRSEAVIRATEPRRLASETAATENPSRAKFSVYSVRVEEALKGDLATGNEIQVALPAGFDVQRPEQLANSLLFLRQLSVEDVQRSNIPPGQKVYLVVSGRYGAVNANVPNRKEAVRAYMETTRSETVRSERVLSWTEQHLKSEDPFLQRSAVIDLYYERGQPKAVEQLGDALRSETVLPAVKGTAIKALEETKNPAAAASLREVAENDKVQRALRQSAVKALGTLPGGEEQLRRWSAGGDQVLAPAAQGAIRSLQIRQQ